MFGTLINFIPGIGQIKLGALIAVGVLFLGLVGTIGYLKIENGNLENTILKKQNLLDNANNVIQQEKEANQSLVRTIEQLKTQIKQIVRESQNAIKSDQNVQSVKDNNVKKLDEQLNNIQKVDPKKPDAYDEDSENFLKQYNEDLDCRRRNPEKLSACQ